MGIVAACGPSLKPLLRNVLKLQTYNAYNDPNIYENRSKRGPGGMPMGSMAAGRSGYVKSISRDDEADLDMDKYNERSLGGADVYRATIKGGHSSPGSATTVYRNDSADRSGSEEHIVKNYGDKKTGIVRTTEISVKF